MADKILIANRGEIAVRIIRACKELGLKTVAVFSQADANSLHVKFADEAYCIGPAAPQKSYLNIPAIISAAEVSGAKAIHPGYGFLAENAHFAQVCHENNIIFIGPSPESISLMGDKNQAKATVKKIGVPLIPGSDGIVANTEELEKVAKKIGFPLIIKASAGGGGKGMRVVKTHSQLHSQFNIAVTEAKAAFNNGDVYVERYIEEPRHVEIQILSDQYGNAIHLGERDCSIQRRHQKLIEESPSPFLTKKLREQMGKAAVKIAKAIKYQGAGTVEFLVDKSHRFYFMEMNTRIQVEHPVTERVTNRDLIKQQLSIALTKKLTLKQRDITFEGHACEFRINAEDPTKNFMPCPGKIDLFLPPGGFGVRIDSHVYPGYVVPPNYDSLLAKLIVWGSTRQEALARAKRALEEFIIDGIPTTIPFFLQVLNNPKFQKGDIDTRFIENYFS